MINKNKILSAQSGLSIISLLCTVAFLGVAAVYGSQIGIGYLTQQTLRGAVKNALIETKNNDQVNSRAVKEAILKKLSVNTIEYTPSMFSVTAQDGGFEVYTEYIKEINITDNIKLVMDLSFTETTP